MTLKQALTALGLSAAAALGTIGYARHSGGTNTENSEGSCYVTRNAEVICAEPAVKCSGDCAFELNRDDLECRLDIPSTEPRAELIKDGKQLYIFPAGYSEIMGPVTINGEIACWDYLFFGKWQREAKQKVHFTVSKVEQPPPPPPPPPPSTLPEIAIELRNPPLYQANLNVRGKVKVLDNGEEKECSNPQFLVTPRRGYLWPGRDGWFKVQLPSFDPRDERDVRLPTTSRGASSVHRVSIYTLTASCAGVTSKEFKMYIKKPEPTPLERVLTCDSLDGLLAHAYAQSKDGPVPVLHHQKAFGSGPQEFERMEMPEDGLLKLDPSGMCGDKIDRNVFYIDFELLNPLNFKIYGWINDRQSYNLYPEEDFNTEKESRQGLNVVIKERETGQIIKYLPLLAIDITPVNDAPIKHAEIDKNLTDLPLGKPRRLGKCQDYFRDVDKGDALTCTLTSSCGENRYNGPDKIGLQIDDQNCAGEQTITVSAKDRAGEKSKDAVTRKITYHLPSSSENRGNGREVLVTRLLDSDEGLQCDGTRELNLKGPAQEIEDNIRAYENNFNGLPAEVFPLPSIIYRSQENKLNEQVTFELTKKSRGVLSERQLVFLERINASAALRGTLPVEKQPTSEQVCLEILIRDKKVKLERKR